MKEKKMKEKKRKEKEVGDVYDKMTKLTKELEEKLAEIKKPFEKLREKHLRAQIIEKKNREK